MYYSDQLSGTSRYRRTAPLPVVVSYINFIDFFLEKLYHIYRLVLELL